MPAGKKNCKHKEKALQQKRKLIRKEMPDAFVGESLSVKSYEDPNATEDSASLWLEKYLNESAGPDAAANQKEAPEMLCHWRRKEYKPQKYSPHSTPKSRLRTFELRKETRYHRCEKHGLVPVQLKVAQPEQLTGMPPQQQNQPRSEGTPKGKTPRTSNSYASSGYSYGPRHDGVGVNFLELIPKFLEGIKKFTELCNEYPRMAATLFTLLFLYWLSFQLQGWLTTGAENLVRVAHPAAHYGSVSLEQFGNRLRSFATSADDLIEGFYCDFARSWCNRFELMCDVRCSFMDKAIQRLRSA